MLVYAVTGLLALAVTFVPLSQALRLPYTVILAALGLMLGAAAMSLAPDGAGPLSGWLKGATSLSISSEVILFLFLPVLVFEAAMSLDVRRLLNEMGAVLLLAIIGLLLSTFIVGFVVSEFSGVGLMTCLLLGAICSATDPVAVVGVFKDVGAPKRLATMVEGESLFNDATALVLFSILSGLMIAGDALDLGQAALTFFRVFLGGILVGLVIAALFSALIDRIKNSPLVNHALSIALAYFSFVLAEHYLHVSGVMAVVTAGLFFNALSDRILSLKEIHALHEGWEQLGFWANSIIFVVMGIVIAGFVSTIDGAQLSTLMVLFIAAMIARAIIVFGLLGAFERLRLLRPASTAYKAVMTWGGLRGAVSLALALIVLENAAFQPEVQQFIVQLVSLFVLSTLFINATTISTLIRWLGLDRLSPVDEILRSRARDLVRGTVREECPHAPSLSDDRLAPTEPPTVAEEASFALGLSILLTSERRLYKALLDQGTIEGHVYGRLSHFVEDRLDLLRHDGAQRISETLINEVAFGSEFRNAVWLHRRFGWSSVLENRLGLRFEMLSAKKWALESVIGEAESLLGVSMGEALQRPVIELTKQRLELVSQNLAALRAQFPAYCAAISRRMEQLDRVNQMVSRLEQVSHSGALSETVALKLSAELERERQKMLRMPPLDLPLDTMTLIGQVSMFQGLDEHQSEALAAVMSLRFCLPGEMVMTEGETGQWMYFIASGALQVALPEQSVLLGSGDFFGEMALINDEPRTATVTALGFCELLGLDRRAFDSVLGDFPEIKALVLETASHRSLAYRPPRTVSCEGHA